MRHISSQVGSLAVVGLACGLMVWRVGPMLAAPPTPPPAKPPGGAKLPPGLGGQPGNIAVPQPDTQPRPGQPGSFNANVTDPSAPSQLPIPPVVPHQTLPVVSPVALERMRFEAVYTGAPLGLESTRLRAVIVAFWNADDLDSVQTLLALSHLKKALAGHRTLFIGCHQQSQPATITADRILAVARSRGANFPLVERIALPGLANAVVGQCLVFDHAGRCIYGGPTLKAHAVIRTAAVAAPVMVVDERNFPRMATVIRRLHAGSLNAQGIVQLTNTFTTTAMGVASGDLPITDIRRQGAALINLVNESGRRRLEEALALRETDPISAVNLIEMVARDYIGLDVWREAKTLAENLKTDRKFMGEYRAAELLDELRAAESDLRPPRNWNGNPRDAAFAEANKAVLTKMRKTLASLRQAAPDSEFARQADRLAAVYGL